VVNWLATRPAIVLFVGLAVVMLAVSVLFTLLAERVFDSEARRLTGSSVTTLVGVVAALYAVLVAFVIVNEWQAFSQAEAETANEAAALTSAYANATTLPEPGRSAIEAALLRYDRAIVCDELPRLATHDAPSPTSRQAALALYATTARYEPVKQSAFYDSLVHSLSDATTARRQRLASAVSPLPNLLVIVIVITSVALIATVSALDTRHRRWHAAITIALSLVVALNLTLIFALDRPFAGAAKVSDAPYREGVPASALLCP
jgi:hypothetical protein